MGLYFNPTGNESKEKILSEFLIKPSPTGNYNYILTDEMVPIVLIFNPTFSTAGIAFSQEEFLQLLDPLDHRPRFLIELPFTELQKHDPLAAEVLKSIWAWPTKLEV